MEDTCPACGQKQLLSVAVCQQCNFPFYGSEREKTRHIQKLSEGSTTHPPSRTPEWRKLFGSIKITW